MKAPFEEPPTHNELTALIEEAVHSLSDGFAIFDADHRLVFANEPSHRWFGNAYRLYAGGLGLADAIFAGIRKLSPDVDDQTCRATADQMAARLRSGKPTDLVTDDGRIVQAVYRPMRGGRMVAVGSDVTALRHKEKELQEARVRAEAASQAKTNFLANISHEIRTPLNGILGMAQVLAAGDLGGEQKEQVEAVLDSGKSLMSIVNDVLDLSKIEAGQLEIAPVANDLSHLLRRLEKLWGARAEEKGIKLIVTTDTMLPLLLKFDPVRVRQCLANLISNAIKFTDRGMVSVRATLGAPTDRDAFVIVRIEDSGVGMNDETLAKLFQPFTQADASTSRRFGGTGLGLSISRDLARLMGGDVTVESALHRGSAFTLTFKAEIAHPIKSPPNADGADESDRTGTVMSAKGARVLIVDDHALNRKVARLFIEPYGFEITEAENGRLAIETLKAQHFDIVLLDVHMPVMDGPQTIRAIRESGEAWSVVPVIALTADAMRGEREKLLALGMNGYVSKPIDQRALISEISRVRGETVSARPQNAPSTDPSGACRSADA